MSIVAFVIARLSSTRLPGKAILPVSGKPMIQCLCERIRASKKIDKVVIATSRLKIDDPLEKLSKKIGVDCYRGSLENIMERICEGAREFNGETIVEILADNPLVHSSLIDSVIQVYLDNKLDYASNITSEFEHHGNTKALFSLGVRVQVYSLETAEKFTFYPEYPSNGKHPSAFIFDNPNEFKIGFLEATGPWKFMNKPFLNFAVNYKKNYEFISKIFDKDYVDGTCFPLESVYQRLIDEPELLQFLGE